MDVERRSAVSNPKKDSNQENQPNQPSGSGNRSPTDQADSFLVFIEM